MENRNILEKYRAKLVREAIFTSAVCALAVGFAVTFVLAFVFWMSEITHLWICVSSGLAVTAAITPLFYFKKFRPGEKEIARRLDQLGLDERMITMAEFADDDSYIARLQREDAAVTLKRGEDDGKKVKFRLAGSSRSAKKIAFTTGTTGVLCVAMSAVLALTIVGILPSGNTLVNGEELPIRYMVSYMEGDGYTIQGEADQIVDDGGSTTEVTVVCEDGWAFVMWVNASDGTLIDDEDAFLKSPVRHEEDVNRDMVFYAMCVEADGDGQAGGSDGEEDDKPQESPPDSSSSSSDGSSGEPSDGDPGSSKYEQNNNVIDENYDSVDYSQLFPEAYEAAKNALANNPNLSAAERAFLEKYFGNMSK